MALANPAATFERRAIRIVSRAENSGAQTYFSRSKVVAMVGNGEMEWVDRRGFATKMMTNTARPTEHFAGTWQKCQSGPVATMQLRRGAKGRYVPVNQREAK